MKQVTTLLLFIFIVLSMADAQIVKNNKFTFSAGKSLNRNGALRNVSPNNVTTGGLSWRSMGPASFGTGRVNSINTHSEWSEENNSGLIYNYNYHLFAYQDEGANNKINLKHAADINNNFEDYLSSHQFGTGYFPSMALGASQSELRIFLAYSASDSGRKVKVYSINPQDATDNIVEEFGTLISPGRADFISIATENITSPYVAFSDSVNGGKLSVRKREGSAWVNVGLPGFSSGRATDITIRIINSVPYVAFKDEGLQNAATMKRFNGTTWEQVGSSNIASGRTAYVKFVVHGTTPLVAYQDSINGKKITVRKYDGTQWVDVGSPGFSSTEVGDLDLRVNGLGTYYVVFADKGVAMAGTVMKFNGTSWEFVGSAGDIPGSIASPSLSFAYNEGTDHHPIVTYSDNNDGGKGKIIKYGAPYYTLTTNGSNGTVNKNPNKYRYRSGESVQISATPNAGYRFSHWSGDTTGTISPISVPMYKNRSITANFELIVVPKNWSLLGPDGLTTGAATFTSLAFVNGAPFVAFRDSTNNNRLSIVKHNGSNWLNAGPTGLNNVSAEHISMASHDGNIYVAYSNKNNSNAASVMHFNGSYWSDLSFSDYSVGSSLYPSLATHAGTLYMAFSDGENSSKATVLEYDPNEPFSPWGSVGTLGFSSGAVAHTKIAISNGTLYVAYIDLANSSKATVKKKSPGSDWVAVGTEGFSSANISHLSFTVNNDTPYVAFSDNAHSSRTTVMKFNGTSWAVVGSPGFTPGAASHHSFVFHDNRPYIAFSDAGNGGRSSVKMFTGSEWMTIGERGISGSRSTTHSLGSALGSLYLAYNDSADGMKLKVKWIDVSKPFYGLTVNAVNGTVAKNADQESYISGSSVVLTATENSGYQFTGWSGDTNATNSSITVSMYKHRSITANFAPVYSLTVTAVNGTVAKNPDKQSYNSGETVTLSATPNTGYQFTGWSGDTTGTTSPITVPMYKNRTITANFAPVVTGPQWTNVGTAGFSAGTAWHPSLAIGSDGTPYVAYQDQSNANKATVMKFNGTNWVAVGTTGFSAPITGEGTDNIISLAMGSDGMPYMAYRDGGNSNKATVMKYNAVSDSWNNVGTPGFSAGDVYFPSLAFGNDGMPYVAYKDGVNPYKLTVKRFTNNMWETVGTEGFSSGRVEYVSLAFSNGIPYVAYADGPNTYKLTVKRFTNNMWETVGTEGFSGGQADYVSLAIGSDGIPYVAYRDETVNYKATVKRFANNTWETVGIAGFTSGRTLWTSLAISNGTPYVAYYDEARKLKATVMKFNGASWDTVGRGGFSAGEVEFTSLAISNGTLYVAYTDGATGYKATVMKYEEPAPVSHTLNVTAANGTVAKNPDKQSYNSGETVTLSATPNTGYQFTGWSGDTTGTTSPITVPMYKNRTITANFAPVVTGPQWTNVGTAGFSAGAASYTSLAIGSDGTPYVAYCDGFNDNKATVKKFDGTSWVTVGTTGFSAGAASYTSLAIGSNGIPYVAYSDGTNSSKTIVKRFTNNTWETVGLAGFSEGYATYLSLAISANGTPFLAYTDGGKNNEATVMKYNGSAWEQVGGAGFSGGNNYYTSLAISSETPYVAYMDGSNGLRATVKRFTNNTWETVGSDGPSYGRVEYVSLAISNGTPYVAYRDWSYTYFATVKKFNGSSWETIGTGGFSAVSVKYTSLAFQNGFPIVAYQDEGSGKATVMKYNGTGWGEVGGPGGFSAGEATHTTLAISNGTPFVAYTDGGTEYKATVMKYVAGASATYTLNVSGANGTVTKSPDKQSYTSGEIVTLTATANSGYVFTGWEDDTTTTQNPINVKMYKNRSITATFKPTYTLSVTAVNGTVEIFPEQVKYGAGEWAFLYATSNDGYVFSHWSGDTTHTIQAFGVVMTSNKSFVANFIPRPSPHPWTHLGPPGFAPSGGGDASMTIDNNSVYVTYRDFSKSGKITVMKYSGSDWAPVGEKGFSDNAGNKPVLAFSNGVPYVLYSDNSVSQYLTMKKYNGSFWETIGTKGFSQEDIEFHSVVVNNHTPYVAYARSTGLKDAVVKTYNGSEWVSVGNSAISSGRVEHLSIAMHNGELYLAYVDMTNGAKATVKKYNGSSWVPVGNTGFSAAGVEDISIQFNNGMPYVAFIDSLFGAGPKATVMRYHNFVWETVGGAGISDAAASTLSMTFMDGLPVVAYMDSAFGARVSVKKFNGLNWQSVGPKGFSNGIPQDVSLGILNGAPVVAFSQLRGILSVHPVVLRYADPGSTTASLSVTAQNGTVTKNPDKQNYNRGENVQITAVPNSGYQFIGWSGDTSGTTNPLTVPMYKDRSITANFAPVSSGAQWTNVGSAGFSAWQAHHISLAFSGSTPYVAYKDVDKGNKATVMKYENGSWTPVGTTGFSAGMVDYTSLAFNGTTPYLAYQDIGNGNKATVMKFENGSWTPVGLNGFSAGSANYISLAFNGSTPYVAYRDDPNGYKATVMKFENGIWTPVGTTGFSAGSADYTSLAFNGTTPYVAYRDEPNGYKTTVMKFENGSWTPVGTAGFSAGGAQYTSLAFNGSTPYLAFSDASKNSKVTVLKFENGSWTPVGTAGFSAGTAWYISLELNGSTPYVAYRDFGNSHKATVMTFNGTNWVNVGMAGFSAGEASYTSLAFSGSTVYVAYNDLGNGNKATVMKFGETPSTYTLNVTGSNATVTKDPDKQSYNPGEQVTLTAVPNAGYQFTGWSGDTTATGVSITVPMYKNRTITANTKETQWHRLGAEGFSLPAGGHVSLEFNNSVPYIAYVERENNNVVVKRYNGSTWQDVGAPGFAKTYFYSVPIAFHNDQLYIAMANDVANGVKVMKYNGAVWESVGQLVMGESSVDSEIELKVNDGIPYLFFNEHYYNGGDISHAAVTYKLINNRWELLGTRTIMSGYNTENLTLGFDGSTVYRGYNRASNAMYANILERFNGSEWVNLSPSNLWLAGSIMDFEINSGYPYVAFTRNDSILLHRYNGNVWEFIGGTSVTTEKAISANLEFSGTTPYIAYSEFVNSAAGAVSVKRYNNSVWESVGAERFSAGGVLSLKFGFSGGTPHVAYIDYAFGERITVMKYGGVVVPPNHFLLTIQGANGVVTVTPKKEYYEAGSSVQLSAKANPGYTFSGWSGDASGKASPITVVMDKNKTITAGFTLIPDLIKLHGVGDVPNDQGKQVFVVWRSKEEIPNAPAFLKYSVWRKDSSVWTFIAEVPSRGDTAYAIVAPTIFDSTKTKGLYPSIFQVTGHTFQNQFLYTSNILAGYSLDNLFPATPATPTAVLAGADLIIRWKAVTDHDFQHYAIYRGITPNFAVKGLEPYKVTTDTTAIDVGVGTTVKYYYKITAIDFSGNESAPSTEVSNTLTGVNDPNAIPKEFALRQNYPNPFNPQTTIDFDIPKESNVLLKVYNSLGQEVATLANGVHAPGRYSVKFGGNQFSSGLYIYRITAEKFTAVKKMNYVK